MNGTKLVLADSSEIILCGGASLGCMKAHYQDREAMLADWGKLTERNLKTVQVITDGTVTGNFSSLVLESETSAVGADGSVDTAWNIREKTREEKLEARITELEEMQAVHDGAIGDLGAAVSAMAEQQEGGQE